MIISAILGAWAALSLFGGEMQRQKQDLDLAREMEARRAARKAAAEAQLVIEARAAKNQPTRKF